MNVSTNFVYVFVCFLTGDPEQDFVGQSYSKVIGGKTLVLSFVVLRSSTVTETDLQGSWAFSHRHPGIFPNVEKLAIPSPWEPEPQSKESYHYNIDVQFNWNPFYYIMVMSSY